MFTERKRKTKVNEAQTNRGKEVPQAMISSSSVSINERYQIDFNESQRAIKGKSRSKKRAEASLKLEEIDDYEGRLNSKR